MKKHGRVRGVPTAQVNSITWNLGSEHTRVREGCSSQHTHKTDLPDLPHHSTEILQRLHCCQKCKLAKVNNQFRKEVGSGQSEHYGFVERIQHSRNCIWSHLLQRHFENFVDHQFSNQRWHHDELLPQKSLTQIDPKISRLKKPTIVEAPCTSCNSKLTFASNDRRQPTQSTVFGCFRWP